MVLTQASIPPCMSAIMPTRFGQNRQRINEMLQLPAEPVWLEQIHSNRLIKAEKGAPLQQADASYTRESGVVCTVLTADCLPLLVCDDDGSQVAAIHAGWRGLLAGIISNTVTAMQGRIEATGNKASFVTPSPQPSPAGEGEEGRFINSAANNLMVWLGPAIGPECFEVGSEVRDAFLAKSEAYAAAFSEQGNGKWLADIYQLARVDLATLGIVNVYGGHFCTVTEHERFYSYRRDKDTGRMATLIWRE